MDGRSRPYFCGLDQTLNSQQKEALARGIQQVISTTPPSFEFFEFQFSGQQVYLYKLHHGIILLVLTTSSLVPSVYGKAIKQLQQELQQDVANTIATFRVLAGSATLSKQDYWRRAQSETVPTLPKEAWMPAAPTAGATDAVSPIREAVSSSRTGSAVTLKEAIAALNQLSKFTTQYLGATVVTNYWKTTCPEVPWLQEFQVERSAQLSFPAVAENPALEKTDLTNEQQQWIQDWVEAFIQRCARVIRDFPKTVRQQALNEKQQFLLREQSA